MDYSELVDTYRQLEGTQATLEKTSILAELFGKAGEELEDVVLLSMGRAFPNWKDLELGISSRTMVDIIGEVTGKSDSEIEQVWKEEGDLGSAAEKIMEGGRGQQTLMQRDLTVDRVNDKLDKVARMEEKSLGSVSMDKKKKEVAELLNDATPGQAKYVVRTFIENLRLGVGEGIVRDALAEAFFGGEHTEDIQTAYNLTNDFTAVAGACREGIEKVRALEMELFRPIKSMLARKVETIDEGFETVGKPAGIDYKYDGMRAQIHREGDEVEVFTRRLENVSEQFPDVVEAVRKHVEAESCIIDAEIVAFDPETGDTIPFQKLSKRIKRKYEIQRLKEEIPVEVRPFDLIYLEGSILENSYRERWGKLESIVSEEKDRIRLADHEVTDSGEKVQEMRQEALEAGQEGIMMKNLEAEYKPGSRVGYMVKLKPVMETLDLAIVGGEWSEGRRTGWIGSLKLGCLNRETGEYEDVGRMATGLTDEQLEEITERLEPLITEENGRQVEVKPDIVVEVEYEEIQESPTYSSGYALRFPRLKQFRDDVEEPDTLERVEELFEGQGDIAS